MTARHGSLLTLSLDTYGLGRDTKYRSTSTETLLENGPKMQTLFNFAVILGFTFVITVWFIARRALDHQALQSSEELTTANFKADSNSAAISLRS